MCKTRMITVIIVTHNSALAKMGDKIIRMRSGKVESVEVNNSPMRIEDIEY